MKCHVKPKTIFSDEKKKYEFNFVFFRKMDKNTSLVWATTFSHTKAIRSGEKRSYVTAITDCQISFEKRISSTFIRLENHDRMAATEQDECVNQPFVSLRMLFHVMMDPMNPVAAVYIFIYLTRSV